MQFFIHSSINNQDPLFQDIEQKLLREGQNLETIEEFPCYKKLHITQAARQGSFMIGRIRFDDARILVMTQGQKCYVMAAFWDHRYERTWLLQMLQSANAPEWLRSFETIVNQEQSLEPMERAFDVERAAPSTIPYDEDALTQLVSTGNFARLLVLSATQTEIQALIQAERPDTVSTVLSLAGHGKTVLAQKLLAEELEQGRPVIYIAPNHALTLQVKQTFKKAGYRYTKTNGSYAEGEEQLAPSHKKKTRFSAETAVNLVYEIAQLFDETQLLTHQRIDGKVQRKEALTPVHLDNYLRAYPLTGFDSGLIHYEIFAVILSFGLDKTTYLKAEQSSLASREERQRLFQYAQQFLDAYKTHLDFYTLARRLIQLYQTEHFVMSGANLLVLDEVHNIPPIFLELFKRVFSDTPDNQGIKQVLLGDPYQMHHPLYTRVDKQIQSIYGERFVKFYELNQNFRVPRAIFSGLYHLLSLENFAFGHRGDLKYQTAPICMQSEEGRICHTLEPLNADRLMALLKSNPEIGFFTSDDVLRNELKQRGCIHVYGSGEYQGLTFKTVILGDSFPVINSREMAELHRLYQEHAARANTDSCFHFQRPTHEVQLQRAHRYALRLLAMGVSRATDTVILMHKQFCLPSSVLPIDHGLDGVASPDAWLLSAQKCLQQGYTEGVIEILRNESLWGDATLLPLAHEWLTLLLTEKREEWQQRCIEQIIFNQSFTTLFAASNAHSIEQRRIWLTEQLALKRAHAQRRFFPNEAIPLSEQSAKAHKGIESDDDARHDSNHDSRQAAANAGVLAAKLLQHADTKMTTAVVMPTASPLSNSLSPKQEAYVNSFFELLIKKRPTLCIKDFWKHSKTYHFLMTHKLRTGKTVWEFLSEEGHSQYLNDLLRPVFADVELTKRCQEILQQALYDPYQEQSPQSIALLQKLNTECEHRQSNKIDIQGINKAELLAALYNAGKTQGYSFYAKNITRMTPEIAQRHLDEGDLYFDYLEGHCMKISLSGPMMNYERYESLVGPGTVWSIVTTLRQQALTPASTEAFSPRL